jgi:hypothetical protein
MGNVVQFPVARWCPADDEIDLLTAVDVALRDLTDIIRDFGAPAMREQAEACRQMLQRAFDAALAAE